MDRKEAMEKRRELEITLLWQRTLIFWGFTVVGFGAYAYCFQDFNVFGTHVVAFMIALFGIVTSFIWTLANRGSKFWQEYYEKRTQERGDEKKVEDFEKNTVKEYYLIGSIINFFLWKSVRFSVGKLIIALSDFILICWISIAYVTFEVIRGIPVSAAISGLEFWSLMFVVAYLIWTLVWTKYHVFQ